jgi:NADH dehydrogenase
MRARAAGEASVRHLVPEATVLRFAQVFGDEDRLLNRWGYMHAFWPLFPAINEARLIQPISAIAVGDAIVETALAALAAEESVSRKTFEVVCVCAAPVPVLPRSLPSFLDRLARAP